MIKKLIFLAIFGLSFFQCASSYADGNTARLSGDSRFESVAVSRYSRGYLIWFKFNGSPENIVSGYKIKGSVLNLAFKGDAGVSETKFIKYKNRLLNGVEIVPNKNSGFNALVYFRKDIGINKKKIQGGINGNYFVVKIYHKFSGGLFKNIGKKTTYPAVSIAPLKLNKSKSNKLNKSKVILSKKNKTENKALQNSPGGSASPKINVGFEAVKTIFYLAIVLGLIYGLYYFMNKFKSKMSGTKKNFNNLKIVSSLNLGNKKSILLIEAGAERFVVGVSNSNIQVIGHIDAASENLENNSNLGINANIDTNVNADVNLDKNNNSDKKTVFSKIYGRNAKMQSLEPDSNIESGFDSNSAETFNGESFNEPTADFAGMLNKSVISNRQAERNQTAEGKSASSFSGLNENEMMGLSKADMQSFKVKNISDAKAKTKADNVFFDIEERLKGLIENGGQRSSASGNAKRF